MAEWFIAVVCKTIAFADVENKLRELGIDVEINSMREKNESAELIERIVFGESSFVDGRLVQKIGVANRETVLSVMSKATNQSRNHIRGLIADGQVRVNGEIVDDPNRSVADGDILQAGKKVSLKIFLTLE